MSSHRAASKSVLTIACRQSVLDLGGEIGGPAGFPRMTYSIAPESSFAAVLIARTESRVPTPEGRFNLPPAAPASGAVAGQFISKEVLEQF